MAGVGPSVLEPTACELVRPSFFIGFEPYFTRFLFSAGETILGFKVTPKIKNLNIV
jgi:hypothetical protein